MTPLIDVIFLLLLFFMLSSTFSRFADVKLATAGAGGAAAESRPVFVQLSAETLTVNGQVHALDALPQLFEVEATQTPDVLISLREGVSAQRLTDLLVVLRGIEGLRVTVLGAA